MNDKQRDDGVVCGRLVRTRDSMKRRVTVRGCIAMLRDSLALREKAKAAVARGGPENAGMVSATQRHREVYRQPSPRLYWGRNGAGRRYYLLGWRCGDVDQRRWATAYLGALRAVDVEQIQALCRRLRELALGPSRSGTDRAQALMAALSTARQRADGVARRCGFMLRGYELRCGHENH